MSLELAIKENTEVMRQLIAEMRENKTYTSSTPHQPKAEGTTQVDKSTSGKKTRKGPFYWKHPESDRFGLEDTEEGLRSMRDADPLCVEITKVEYLQLQEEASKATFKPVTLESQPLPVAVALAYLFGEKGRAFNEEMITEAVAITETEDGKERDAQIDALTMALKGVDRASKLHGAGVFDLALQMFEHWDALPGITERRTYADLLLDTPREDRAKVKPVKPKGTTKQKAETPDADPKALFAQAEQLILTLAKGGYRSEAVKILADFGATRLGAVKPEDLPAVIEAAEKALEG
ncbi:hypothetical protein H8I91_13265 [Serratia fonticola]|uniref:hypothetical protein n=1 Tax=Serratia fonticola TaxID=47917 RepID=UPI001647F7F9|nr:hypothetical protein [Serratia fonticola]MBC3251239.1 hypothetical protein [Serratia fonticola]